MDNTVNNTDNSINRTNHNRNNNNNNNNNLNNIKIIQLGICGTITSLLTNTIYSIVIFISDYITPKFDKYFNSGRKYNYSFIKICITTTIAIITMISCLFLYQYITRTHL